MTWLERQKLKHFVSSSGWLVPTVALPAGVAIFRTIWLLDRMTNLDVVSFTPDGARTLLGALVSAMLTFIVFAFSLLTLAVQLVSTSLSPRIIAIVYRNPAARWALGLFMFTFVFSVALLGRIDTKVPELCMLVAIALSVLSIATFVVLVDYFGKSLRPVSVLSQIGDQGVEELLSVYPYQLVEGDTSLVPTAIVQLGAPDRVVDRTGASGVVVAFDAARIAAIAERADCTIELVPQVGDFVAKRDPLFNVYGARAAEVRNSELSGAIAFGDERTFDQDPLFALRIVVDVASRALSPAINDPTTAVLAIDQLHRLLRTVGRRRLDAGVVRDTGGRVRFVYRTPDWEDFVRLAATEIRHFGIGSIQVVRRMRAMLESLAANLPSERARIVADQLDHLNVAAARAFPDEWDRRMAAIGDSQGMGSPAGRSASQPLRAAAR